MSDKIAPERLIEVQKKEFLDALEDSEGSFSQACIDTNIKEKIVRQWMQQDEIFEEAIHQIQAEASLPDTASSSCMTATSIGIRPHDLYNVINARLSNNTPPSRITWNTAKKMCKFIGYLRGMMWDHAEARRLAKVSSATINRWRREHPEFDELVSLAEHDAILDVYSVAIRRALDPSAAGDAMRKLILKGKGHLIGFQGHAPSGGNTQVNVTVQRTPEEADAITRAHQKALEPTPLIEIPKK